jgi:hypothetical protein
VFNSNLTGNKRSLNCHMLIIYPLDIFKGVQKSKLVVYSIFDGGIPLKPELVPHTDYQAFVIDQLRHHFSGGLILLCKNDWPVILKCLITDLSSVTSLLRDDYSMLGPAPRDPASMMRAYLLMLFVRPEIGITKWVDQLNTNRLYAILSGFDPGDVPGVGTFYDFFARLWGKFPKNIKPRKQRRKKKAKRGKKKGEKAPTATPGRVQRLVNWMMRHLDKQVELPSDRLFSLFHDAFLTVSAKLGLLGDVSRLSIAGDGMPVTTAAWPRGKSSCDCRAQGLASCDHPRLYSQPDCDTGWDSSRERYFNGYHLYTLTAADSPHDLPLYPRLHPASRHDSVSFVLGIVEFSQRSTLGPVDKLILDSAHDAGAIYDLILHQNGKPFIDLNVRSTKNLETDHDIRLSPQGIPICPANLEMKHDGFDHAQKRHKWKCPLMKKRTTCTCDNPCSDAKYGRTFHTQSQDNPRLFPEVPRGSESWKLVYKRRTTVERSNKRTKIDYKLEAGRHRYTMMWMIRTYAVMMCQHIDAWYRTGEKELQAMANHILPQAI